MYIATRGRPALAARTRSGPVTDQLGHLSVSMIVRNDQSDQEVEGPTPFRRHSGDSYRLSTPNPTEHYP